MSVPARTTVGVSMVQMPGVPRLRQPLGEGSGEAFEDLLSPSVPASPPDAALDLDEVEGLLGVETTKDQPADYLDDALDLINRDSSDDEGVAFTDPPGALEHAATDAERPALPSRSGGQSARSSLSSEPEEELLVVRVHGCAGGAPEAEAGDGEVFFCAGECNERPCFTNLSGSSALFYDRDIWAVVVQQHDAQDGDDEAVGSWTFTQQGDGPLPPQGMWTRENARRAAPGDRAVDYSSVCLEVLEGAALEQAYGVLLAASEAEDEKQQQEDEAAMKHEQQRQDTTVVGPRARRGHRRHERAVRRLSRMKKQAAATGPS